MTRILLPGAEIAGASRPDRSVRRHTTKLMKKVMMSAFVKSMKNAPTIGITRKARGADKIGPRTTFYSYPSCFDAGF